VRENGVLVCRVREDLDLDHNTVDAAKARRHRRDSTVCAAPNPNGRGGSGGNPWRFRRSTPACSSYCRRSRV
jgi:hypothetical protein